MAAGVPGTVMVWQDGERERWWSRAAALEHGREQPDWVTAVTGADHLSDLTQAQLTWLVARGPEPSARALLGKSLVLLRHRARLDVDRVAVARFELDALPLALRDAGEDADRLGLLLLPFRGPEPAVLVAGWLRHLGSARLWARLWLHRHAETAALALAPAAAGRPGRARQQAEDALRFLTATGHAETVARATRRHGVDVPLWGPPPARGGRTPAWARPGALPQLTLADGGTMPPDDVARLVGSLTWSRLDAPPEPPPGDPAPPDGGMPVTVESSAAAQPFVEPPAPEAEKLIAACDPAGLARLGRALLEGWLADGMPAGHAWAVLAQAHVGDDATMDVLAPLVRSWPARSRWARAIDGLAVLATAGTDAALRHLLSIEEGMSGGPTNERAAVYLTQAAGRRGLTVTQLADRLAPTLGLDRGITLDYGPRTFAVIADEHLTAHVVDATGRRLARPPKPGAKDTNPAAYDTFATFRKNLRAAAAAQVARLHRDMLARRLRPARDLAAVVLPHPILGPLARRLLWGEYGPGARLVRALRIAEDGTFADVEDGTATVDPDAPLGVVHPAELGTDLPRWTRLFTDYEILPPLPQLHRPVVVLTGAERAATSLAGPGPVPAEHVLGLLRRGWQGNGHDTAQRLHTQLWHRLPGGLALVAEMEPGITTWSATGGPPQRVTELWVDDAWSDHLRRTRHVPFGDCDPAALSEVLVELRAAGD
ncbi:DUF4132 domain-containing protein [Dactylosporangium aurantiacum]|uniref:DUF4132 domain-containing protein n=1 Tax=Dactylosporangium aurantiacum TaxID=35754 RepID=A0A9Q9M917_9ACTN|nr:DUF4132 domain-containing protein [Dactylosporangium aurantiacum]MDG6109658.1 DUF4132 domain-containing protein [Dactylosporangium aurantiacum]UWZ50273.1 DUF4132 domain-containing protein [Dactylosporangium aurantiacum]